MRKDQGQIGDTIIEVLLAMTIIGLILAGAYATASRSLDTSQFSQERTKATRLAESQLEQLKALTTLPSETTSPAEFCIDLGALNPVVDANDSANPNACIEDVFFKKLISVVDNTYTVKIEWTPPGGSDTNKANATLVYIYEEYDPVAATPEPASGGGGGVSSPPTTTPVVTTGSGPSGIPPFNNVLISGSTINSDGGTAITERGIAYSTSPSPTILDRYVVAGETSPFDIALSVLNPNTTYYLRAFATNSNGTSYGDPGISLTTGPLTAGGFTANRSGSYNGSDYYFIDSEQPWSTARLVAKAVGGELVTITSQEENNYVVGLAQNRNIWIGLTDRATEGTWVWDDGTPVTYTNWTGGEPNDWTPGEDYAVMYTNGKWNDWFNTGVAAPFIIEFDGAPLP